MSAKLTKLQQLAEFAQQKLGRIDIWVNNAGVSQIPKASLADTAAEQIQQIVTTNMLGALLGSRIALQTMNVQTSGQTSCSATKSLFSCLSQSMNMLLVCHAMSCTPDPLVSAFCQAYVLCACCMLFFSCPIASSCTYRVFLPVQPHCSIR